jgi:hypothetical protein
VVAAAVVLTGCDRVLCIPPRDCPYLEEAIDSVAWAPGKPLVAQGSGSGDGGIEVSRRFGGFADLAEAEGRAAVIRAALETAGFEVEVSNQGVAVATLGRLRIRVFALSGESDDAEADLFVAVGYEGSDSPKVVELLDPVRRALS